MCGCVYGVCMCCVCVYIYSGVYIRRYIYIFILRSDIADIAVSLHQRNPPHCAQCREYARIEQHEQRHVCQREQRSGYYKCQSMNERSSMAS